MVVADGACDCTSGDDENDGCDGGDTMGTETTLAPVKTRFREMTTVTVVGVGIGLAW